MFGQPCLDLRMLVRGVVVGDAMDIEMLGRCSINRLEKLQKFLMPVPFHALTDDFAFENIQCGEQGRGSVAFIIMRHRAEASRLHRQSGLGTVKRLYLGLFVKTEHQSMLRRAEIKPHDILQLFHKMTIIRQLERLNQMRFQSVRVPDALYRSLADAADFGYSPTTPMRFALRSLLRFFDDFGFFRAAQGLEAASARTILVQGFKAAFGIAATPVNDRRARCF